MMDKTENFEKEAIRTQSETENPLLSQSYLTEKEIGSRLRTPARAEAVEVSTPPSPILPPPPPPPPSPCLNLAGRGPAAVKPASPRLPLLAPAHFKASGRSTKHQRRREISNFHPRHNNRCNSQRCGNTRNISNTNRGVYLVAKSDGPPAPLQRQPPSPPPPPSRPERGVSALLQARIRWRGVTRCAPPPRRHFPIRGSAWLPRGAGRQASHHWSTRDTR